MADAIADAINGRQVLDTIDEPVVLVGTPFLLAELQFFSPGRITIPILALTQDPGAVDPSIVALRDPPVLLVSNTLCSDRSWCPR